MPPKTSGSGKKPTPNRPPSPTNDPPERPAPTINKQIALAIILARLDATRDMDWFGLSLDLAAGHAGLPGTKEEGGKKRGRKSEEGLSGSVLRDMYYSIILPALKAGKTPWDTTSDTFLSAASTVEHHQDRRSGTTGAVNTVDNADPEEGSKSKVVPSALTKKDPNVPTVAAAVPVTPRQPAKPISKDTNNVGTVKRKAIRVYTSASKRRFKRDSSEEEEWSMGSEEA